MKRTDVTLRKGTLPIVDAVHKALLRARKKLKVEDGGMTEAEWYSRCAEALLLALEHVKNNLHTS